MSPNPGTTGDHIVLNTDQNETNTDTKPTIIMETNATTSTSLELPAQIEVQTTGNSFSLNDLALPQGFADLASVTSETMNVPLQKPDKQTWFSPHPDPKTWRAFAILKDLLKGENYVVHPALYKELAVECAVKWLVPCITKQGSYYVWPIGTPAADGTMNPWYMSAMNIVKANGGKWIRLTANMESGGYELSSPINPPPPPVWTEDASSIIEKSMNGKVIDTLSHSLVKRLRGEI